MTGPAGFLDFFVLEASDYVEQLDGLLLRASATGPDAGALQRIARALRGAATMAKLRSFANLAGAVERVGRGLHDGSQQWDPALSAALVAAIDELKTLIHAARTWSDAEDRRAESRVASLAKYAPSAPSASLAPPTGRGSTAMFFASEAANIGAGLELLKTPAASSATLTNVLARVRALRGVSGVAEFGALGDVLEAIEEAAREREQGTRTEDPTERELLDAASVHLRALASALRGGSAPDATDPTKARFYSALEAWNARMVERDRIVPIAELFYSDDASGVLEPASSPPTSANERFRLELVSLGEHLRRVLDALRTGGQTAGGRGRRDLTRALHAIQSAATSFGERGVAEFIAARATGAESGDDEALGSFAQLAAVLTAGSEGDELRQRLRGLVEQRAPASADTEITATAPKGIPASSLLDSTIEALDALGENPFAAPMPIPEDTVVPIDTLLYRGRAALDRAVAIRDDLRKRGGSSDQAALDELFDLLDLARAE
ncbi:MAG TPA: Hpt domain-containing protein [Gemmatimonadaceae bacterium]|nr:Hpt domain-containing protein [Gemmatimonadaceae bacterium]